MFTAVIAVLTPAFLAVILALAAGSGHRNIAGKDIFRYPAGLAWFIFSAVPGWAFLSVFLLRQIYPKGPASPLDWAYVSIFVLIGLGLIFAFVYVRQFSLSVESEQLAVRALGRQRELRFSDVARLDVVRGAKSRELSLFDRDGKRILGIGATIQDFHGLASLLEERVRKHGAVIRHRDQFGKWSQVKP